jgi:hypothetical protein
MSFTMANWINLLNYIKFNTNNKKVWAATVKLKEIGPGLQVNSLNFILFWR